VALSLPVVHLLQVVSHLGLPEVLLTELDGVGFKVTRAGGHKRACFDAAATPAAGGFEVGWPLVCSDALALLRPTCLSRMQQYLCSSTSALTVQMATVQGCLPMHHIICQYIALGPMNEMQP